MLRVLTLSTLYPDAGRPNLGLFVERQTRGLAALPEVAVEVVAARGLPPWPLSLHPHYRGMAGLPGEEERNGLRVHRPVFTHLPGFEGRAGRAMAKALLPFLRQLRERFPFDVIDAEFFWPDGVAALRLSRALGVPFSVKARGSDIHHWGARPSVRPQLIEAAREAGGLLAVSAALKGAMAALGMPDEKIAVHYTGVDAERFRPLERSAAKAALGVEGPLLVTAGALIHRKGQALTLRALAQVPDATLLVVGDGPDRRMLDRLARELGVAGRVRFLGARPHDALPGLLGAADVMVLPSLSEGLANVWVEALACGTPIVISDAGGATEVVDRPEAGHIVAREPAAIAAAVREMLAASPDPHAVRSAAERFSWARNAGALYEHLSPVAKG
jgi:teichuronic acid biosynthesis glycosyltransferase TuaC